MRKIIFAFTIIVVLYCVEKFTAPTVGKAVTSPFKNSDCLVYEERFPYLDGADASSYSVCFENTSNGFREIYSSGLTSTYDKGGFMALTPDDIAIWQNKLGEDRKPEFIKQLNVSIMKRMRQHCQFYGPPDMENRQLFYDKYPVTAFTEYNGGSLIL